MKLQKFLDQQLEDANFREEWYKPTSLGVEIALIRRINGLSQSELAKKVGTKQSAISRLENTDDYISLQLLHKVARALDYYLEVKFIPDPKNQPQKRGKG